MSAVWGRGEEGCLKERGGVCVCVPFSVLTSSMDEYGVCVWRLSSLGLLRFFIREGKAAPVLSLGKP